MAIKIRKQGAVIASFATPQEIIISHANDSVRVGDGTDLVGPLQNVGGVLCFPVKPLGGGDASASNQTSGAQKTQVVDAGGVVAEIDDVGGEKAIKVSVISTVASGSAPSAVDDAAFTVGTDAVSPIGALFDDVATDSVNEGDVGLLRMTADRLLKIQIAGILAGVAIPITDNSGSLTVDGTVAVTGVATEAKQDTIIGHIDGLEGLLTTIDADTGNLAAIAASLNTLDSIDYATQTTLAAILVDTGQIEALLTTIDADTGNLATMLTALQLIDDVIFVDDAAFTAATSKVAMIGGQYQSSPNALDDGDAGSILLDASHRVVTSVAVIAAGDNNIGNVDVVTLPDATVIGKAAHDAAVSGNPVRVAGRAMLANGTAVAEDDVADLATDNQGRAIVTLHTPRDLVTQATGSQATTTEATMLAAGAAGVFHDITKLIFTNSNTTTAAQVQIRDATAGTIRLELIIAANGGAVIDFGAVPMTQTTAANNWTIDLNSAVSTVYFFVQAIKRIA